MDEKPVREVPLDNGLTLSIYDYSRPVTGERWVVRMVARIDIPVAPVTFPRMAENPDALEVLGPTIVFEKIKERHFVKAEKKVEEFRLICDAYLEASLAYLSHPDFGRKFVMKQYREMLVKRGR